MIGNRPTVEIRGPTCNQRPSGLIIGAQPRLGQQFGRRHTRLENVGLPEPIGESDTPFDVKRRAPVLRKRCDLWVGQAEIAPVNLVIGAHLFRAGRVGLRFELLQSGFGGHSTVTDFARLRGWSTSVPFATAVW